MESFKTPLKSSKKLASIVHIPPSPQMKTIGLGTGVAVYELHRSPRFNKFRSPWAVKKLVQRFKSSDSAQCVNKRVQTEADILRKLDHPNIVGFRAFMKEKDGTNILAMEECTSCLGNLIENRLDYLGEVPYTPKTILKVSHDISKALDYLHNKMLLLHSDIKSFNILVKGDFEICKLCDFGVCLPLTESGEIDLKKADNVYTGTLCWSPPEVLKFNPEITTKADIYSLGLVIWEMLALSPPIGDDFLESNDDDLLESNNGDLLESNNGDLLESNNSDLLESNNGDVLESNAESYSETDIVKKRPDLPDVDLGPEYKSVLEIYFCCTALEKSKRPTAYDLVKMLDEVSEIK